MPWWVSQALRLQHNTRRRSQLAGVVSGVQTRAAATSEVVGDGDKAIALADSRPEDPARGNEGCATVTAAWAGLEGKNDAAASCAEEA